MKRCHFKPKSQHFELENRLFELFASMRKPRFSLDSLFDFLSSLTCSRPTSSRSAASKATRDQSRIHMAYGGSAPAAGAKALRNAPKPTALSSPGALRALFDRPPRLARHRRRELRPACCFCRSTVLCAAAPRLSSASFRTENSSGAEMR